MAQVSKELQRLCCGAGTEAAAGIWPRLAAWTMRVLRFQNAPAAASPSSQFLLQYCNERGFGQSLLALYNVQAGQSFLTVPTPKTAPFVELELAESHLNMAHLETQVRNLVMVGPPVASLRH